MAVHTYQEVLSHGSRRGHWFGAGGVTGLEQEGSLVWSRRGHWFGAGGVTGLEQEGSLDLK